jgi:hypothetical protein
MPELTLPLCMIKINEMNISNSYKGGLAGLFTKGGGERDFRGRRGDMATDVPML